MNTFQTYREAQGLSIRGMAAKTGASTFTIIAAERNPERVSIKQKAKIASALHVEMFRLFPELKPVILRWLDQKPVTTEQRKAKHVLVLAEKRAIRAQAK